MKCRLTAVLIFKMIFGLAWALLAAEIFLRWLHPVPVVPRYVTASPYGIRCNEPNRVYRHTSADYRIEIRTNSKGIRCDEEIPYEKPAGVKRIVVLGDSFGMGYEVDLSDTFLVRMEQQLRNAGYNVQVVNLSVSGHSNAEELLVLQNEGVKYEPDLVLLCWHRSDLNENIRCGLYALEEGQLVRKNQTYLPGVAIQERLYSIPGYNWIQAHSNLYAFTREWVSWNVAKPLLLFLRSRSKSNEVPTKPSPKPASVTDYPEYLTVQLLKEIKKTAGTVGARFLILDIPEHSDNVDFLSRFPQSHIKESDQLLVVSPLTLVEERAGELLYWMRSQRHFTPLGCQIVGDFLADKIIENGLLATPETAPVALELSSENSP